MDPNYDLVGAVAMLQEITHHSSEYPRPNEAPILTSFDLSDYEIVYVEEPRSWRLVPKGDPDDYSEAVGAIYGILCKSCFPPIRSNRIDGIRRRAALLRQSAQLTGLDTSVFEAVVEKIYSIEELFTNALRPQHTNIVSWAPGNYEGYAAIEAGARYFTPRKYVPKERGQPFNPHVDPYGILASIRGQNLIHGSDNKVDYLREVVVGGVKRTVRVDPRTFAPGDIVRMSVSFVCTVNPRTDEVKMSVLLKAITLLIRPGQQNTPDDNHVPGPSTDNDPPPSAGASIPKVISIKRRKIFEEERDATEAMNRLSIADSSLITVQ